MTAFEYWIAAGVIIGALALLLQGLSAFGLYRNVKRLREEIAPLIPETRQTLESARATLQNASARIDDIHAKAGQILDLTQRQLVSFDQTRTEMTNRLRIQAERIELVVDDSLSRVHELVNVLHTGVMKPVREVSGVVAGLRTGLQTFLRGRRPSVAEATHDEELFI
jgi:hypothetical protein